MAAEGLEARGSEARDGVISRRCERSRGDRLQDPMHGGGRQKQAGSTDEPKPETCFTLVAYPSHSKFSDRALRGTCGTSFVQLLFFISMIYLGHRIDQALTRILGRPQSPTAEDCVEQGALRIPHTCASPKQQSMCCWNPWTKYSTESTTSKPQLRTSSMKASTRSKTTKVGGRNTPMMAQLRLQSSQQPEHSDHESRE